MANNTGLVTALKRGRSSSEIIQQFNAVNAKILAALLVVSLVCYHGILRLTNGSDSCQWLLSDGRFHSDQHWQPYGCMLHQYSSLDANQCLRSAAFSNNIMFIGDSRIRELFRSFTEILNPKPETLGMSRNELGELDKKLELREDTEARPVEKAHYDLSFVSNDANVKISNYWSPVLNESFVDLFKKLSKNRNNIPRVIVAGTGTWEIKASKTATKESLGRYKENLRLLLEVLDQWPVNSTKFIWKLQDPVDIGKLSPDRQMIQNDVIDAFNSAALEVLKHSRFQVWRSGRLVTESLPDAHRADGLHVGLLPLKHHVQILLNLYCNGFMEFHDGTCCKTAEPTTTLQLVTFTVLLMCFVLTVTWLAIQSFRRRRKQRMMLTAMETQLEEAEETGKELEKSVEANGIKENSKDGSVSKSHAPAKKNEPEWQVLITSLGKMGLIMAYFYLCDRTNCFMKENKHYSAMNFWLPVGYVFALGLFFNEKSRSTKILHRDQTDEWKGWMQLVILIYHMTGASRVVPLYMQIRVLVSSYLFLTGYGHFCFFWNGGSASFVRFMQVIFRMNLMTVVICLCMNRPYQSYYFVPLVTFWYMVVYLTLVLPPQITASLCDTKPISYLYIILKFIGLFTCITILYMSEVFFENIFLTRPWKALFVTPDDQVHEWWFRWSLDRYSICFGLVFGFLYVSAQKYGMLDDSVSTNLWQRGKTAFVALVSLAGIGGYTAFTFACHKKPECNEVHPYIAFVPIIGFVMLRNVFGAIRVRYSSFFAWFGRISLELFIGQYHIWLAADTHGVLVLIPNYPVLNVIVTSYILVCVAHEIHLITGQLAPLAVPSDWKRTLRNVVLFFLALVPIAVHDGML